MCRCSGLNDLPNEGFDGFNWLVAIRVWILLLLKGVSLPESGPEASEPACLFVRHSSTIACPFSMQMAACGCSQAGACCLFFCMLDVWGLAQMTDECVYGKLLATVLHESEWLTDKKALFHSVFVCCPRNHVEASSVFLFTIMVTVSLWSSPTHSWSPEQKLYTGYILDHAHVPQAPPTSEPWTFRTLTRLFDKRVDGLLKQAFV